MAKKKPLRTPALDELQAAPYNPRGIHEPNLDGLKFSLESFGDISGIVWNQRTGHLVTGHQRLRSLTEEHGEELLIEGGAITWPDGETFPVRTVDWTIAKEQAANVAANNPHLGGHFTPSTSDLLDKIRSATPALHGGLLFEALSADLGGSDKDEATPEKPAPSKPETAVTKPGDLWVLGPHRLHCADATIAKSFGKLMGPREKAALVFTDPPYGVSYEDTTGKGIIANDELRDDKLANLVGKSLRWAAKHAADDAAFYIWHASDTRDDFAAGMAAAGITQRQYIIWIKPSFALGRGDYQQGHEPCFYAGKAGQPIRFIGDRKQSTVWRVGAVAPGGEIAYELADGVKISTGDGGLICLLPKAPGGKRVRKVRLEEGQDVLIAAADDGTADTWHVKRDPVGSYGHPTQKPTALAAIAIGNNTVAGEIVLDMFGGSGSTLMAADGMRRHARLLELDPRYCDVIVERWQDRTGHKATRTG